jgi:hypothetical protein
MFTDTSFLALADTHRRALLADADNFRLAKLARAARRHATRPPTPPVEPPRQPVRGRENDDANRRYAVSR